MKCSHDSLDPNGGFATMGDIVENSKRDHGDTYRFLNIDHLKCRGETHYECRKCNFYGTIEEFLNDR